MRRRDNDADEDVDDAEKPNAHACAVPDEFRPLTCLGAAR